MEELGTGFNQLAELLLWPYMVIFILLSYLIKKHFGVLLQKITRFEWKPVYTVLILATLTGILYGLFTEATWVAIFLSYAVGTTFHETILEFIVKKITGK